MKPLPLRTITRDILMAAETQTRLGRSRERLVTFLARLLEFRMPVRQRARHHEFLERGLRAHFVAACEYRQYRRDGERAEEQETIAKLSHQ